MDFADGKLLGIHRILGGDLQNRVKEQKGRLFSEA